MNKFTMVFIIIFATLLVVMSLLGTVGAIFNAVGQVNEPAEQTTMDEITLDEQYPYKPLEENFILDLENFKIYNPDELTAEILETRTASNTLIVERVIGKVVNKTKGDGRILNTESEYNYISYFDLGIPISDGTLMLTYLIYNPDTDFVDDCERYDFILSREYED